MEAFDRALMEFMEPMVIERRLNLIDSVLGERTRYITILLEDLFQPHNASAVMRSCDCFGIQDIHIIENRNKHKLNPEIELGSAQWLNIYTYKREIRNTKPAIEKLKSQGYRVVATTPHIDDVSLGDFDLGRGKVALLFGTERQGLSEEALSLADEYLKIPMVGFTESLNISVSAAIILQTLRERILNSDIDWRLSQDEKDQIRLQWIRNSVRNSKIIETAFKKRYIK